MQYLVEGADRTSGTDRTVIFDAANERDAQRQAEEMNLLVSRMSPHASGIPNDRPAIDYATPGVGRGAATISPGGPPRYLGLKIASFVLGVSCVLSYGFALILAVAAIHSFVSASASQVPFAPPPALVAADGSMQLFVAFVTFAGAALQHGLSAGCIALRDIARNSFRS
jgi:hypothetical protein